MTWWLLMMIILGIFSASRNDKRILFQTLYAQIKYILYSSKRRWNTGSVFLENYALNLYFASHILRISIWFPRKNPCLWIHEIHIVLRQYVWTFYINICHQKIRYYRNVPHRQHWIIFRRESTFMAQFEGNKISATFYTSLVI